MARLKGRDMADDPPELRPPKINSHYYAMDHNKPLMRPVTRQLQTFTPKRYKSQQARDTKTQIRRGGRRGG
jgi:hypothetical protein